MKSKREIIFLILLVFITFFLRFYKLGEIPNGLNQDETAIGYNAYSILKTGKDEYGKPFPLYFRSFGDKKLPVYIYLTSISEGIFGVNEFAVRFPSAFLGSLTVLFFFLLVKAVTQNKKLAFVSALLLAINPWHLFFSRAAFEDNAALSFAVFGSWIFVYAVRSQKWIYLFLSLIGFALCVYSYNVTRLLAPLLLLTLLLIHRKYIATLPTIKKSILTIFLLVLLSPFLLTLFSSSGAASAKGALVTSADITAKGFEFREYFIGTPFELPIKIIFNKYIYMVLQYIINLVESQSASFFFISGSDHGTQGIGNIGQFYLFEFPLMLAGFIILFIKEKSKNATFFLFWYILVFAILCLSKQVPHATRGYFLVIPMEVFSAAGIIFVYTFLSKLRNKNIKKLIYITCSLLVFYNLIYYFASYYIRFPLLYASDWRQQDKGLSLYIKENEKKYDKIIIDDDINYVYTSYLFYSQYDPAMFQKTEIRKPDDSEGFSFVQSFGKYDFSAVDWRYDLNKKNVLFVTNKKKAPSDEKILKYYYFPEHPVAISVKEQVEAYKIHDVAYELIESNKK